MYTETHDNGRSSDSMLPRGSGMDCDSEDQTIQSLYTTHLRILPVRRGSDLKKKGPYYWLVEDRSWCADSVPRISSRSSSMTTLFKRRKKRHHLVSSCGLQSLWVTWGEQKWMRITEVNASYRLLPPLPRPSSVNVYWAGESKTTSCCCPRQTRSP